MFAVVVIICHLATGGVEIEADCDEVVITRTATMMACMMPSEPAIAQWKEDHAIYRDYSWAVKEWRCERWDYEPKRSA